MVIYSKENNVIVEVAIPWDSSVNNLGNMAQFKLNKYKVIAEGMKKTCKKCSRVLPVVFCARGLPAPKTITALKKIRVPRYKVEFLCANANVGYLCIITIFMA